MLTKFPAPGRPRFSCIRIGAFFSETPANEPDRKQRAKNLRSGGAGAEGYSDLFFQSFSASARQRASEASEGILCPSRGERVKPMTAGPSAEVLRLYCWAKKRRR